MSNLKRLQLLDSSQDDPTSVVRVLDEYKMTRRQSMKRRERSPIAQQIQFQDDSSPNFSPRDSSTRRLPSHWNKVPKLSPLGQDPLEKLSVLQPAANTQRSFSNASNVLQETNESQAKLEKNKLQMSLVEKETQFLEATNKIQKMEVKMHKMELLLQKGQLEHEAATEKMKLKQRRLEDDKNELQAQVDLLKKKEQHRRDLDTSRSNDQREYRNNLEDQNRDLLEQNQQLEQQVHGYEQELEGNRRYYTEEGDNFRYQIQQLQSHVEEAQAQSCRDGEAARETNGLKQKLEETESALQSAHQENERLKHELNQNADAEIQRNAMKDKLARYPRLVKENEALKMENNLLNETMENTELLKKQVSELKEELARSQEIAGQVSKAQSDLVQERRNVKRWEGVCQGILSSEEKTSLGGNVGPESFEQKIAMMQRSELVLRGELETVKST